MVSRRTPAFATLLRMHRRFPHRLASLARSAIFTVVALSCCVHAETPPPADLGDQRERFALAWEAAQHVPGDAWRKLAAGLERYPLFPYLELASLERNMAHVDAAEVDKFLAAWPDSLPAQLLRESYLQELARRGEWKNFLARYVPATRSKELQCDALQAKLALGQKLDFSADVEPLWLSASALPSACDAALGWAEAQGKLGADLVWRRIDLAARAGNAELVAKLAAKLAGDERAAAERMVTALRDAAAATNDAAGWPDAPHSRDAAVIALERLTRRDSDAAEAQWTKLGTHFHFDTEQRNRVLHALALYRATSYAPDAQAALDALPAEAADDATREWRVRVALAAQDWKRVRDALDAMSPAQQADARWRYLRARMEVKLGAAAAAKPIFEGVAQEANFHGFLAADWLDRPYTICQAQAGDERAEAQLLQHQPALARAFEFFALNRLREARHEWDFGMASLAPNERRIAAAAATRHGWYDRAVYTLNQGDDLHLYDLRFPLARRTEIEHDAQAAGIDAPFAYAIIRAESAWTADAHSGADAWGLMQLLPSTARQLAKVEKVSFSGAADLLDPALNIRLGTRYLADIALHYDGSPWLASAAYNAGEDPLGRWIAARDALEPDFFIETIPYKETRDYVARVLAFDVIYDWRLHGSAQSLASRLPRIGQAYTPPPADAPRKSVVCPAAAPAEPAAETKTAAR